MLNKNLLLSSNSQDSKNYTHIVTVGQRTGYMIYGYDDRNYGSIDTNAVNIPGLRGTIDSLRYDKESGLGSSLILAGFIDKGASIYLGRSDTKVNFGTPYLILDEQGTAKWSGELFTWQDVGKEIPIWLSSSPPPY